MNAVLEINPDLKDQLHLLAEETHRTETELANEALTAFLEHDRWFRAKVQASIQDPRPNIPHDQVMTEIDAIIVAAEQRQGQKTA